ncbi:MAG TPA: CPBP family intramembrane glutamic endopeptidase [Chthoniobacterales bacterium]
MKDAARLLAYLTATLLFGALSAPILYWSAQALAQRGLLRLLSGYDFETYFHRALLGGALLFFWPLLRSLRVRSFRDLGIVSNPAASRDAGAGLGIAAVPLLCFGALLLNLGIYSLRPSISLSQIGERVISAAVVPFIEEPLFRGLILGVLLRASTPVVATLATSALFSILHFLKAPENTSPVVTWTSGFVSIGNSFAQFSDPLLVLAGFTTLFLLGWILADARIRTQSLWLPIGLHAGWILASAVFNKLARRELVALPWLGKSLLIGIAPLAVALVSWGILRLWLHHVDSRNR